MLNLAAGFSQSEYTLTRSLRFRASASAYLNRTPAAGNRQIWTWSGWVKRGALGAFRTLFSAGTSNTEYSQIRFNSADTFSYVSASGGTTYINLTSSAVYRDTAAWYHIVISYDDAQATASNRVKIYVNGTQITAFSTATYPPQNYQDFINGTSDHKIGRFAPSAGDYFDGYMAETYFIDGQALTPSSFGETNALTGVWQPKAYTGTYGTNGFYLDFEDTSSVAALGTDSSGNGNTWTVNNVSLTAGVTYDSMTDVPTLTSATTANYAVLNPLTSDGTISNANLTIAWASGNSSKPATIGVSSGKWYCELLLDSSPSNAMFAGIIPASMNPSASYPGSTSGGYGYFGDGQKYFNGASSAYGTAISVNDIVGIAFDADSGKLWFSRNGTWQASGDPAAGTNAAFTSIPAGTWFLSAGHSGTCTLSANFGQRSFAYTPPTGFVALNTFNLPTATILKGSNNFNIALDTGANIKTTTEALFSGSQFFEWIKDYVNSNDNQLTNSVTGTSNILVSNSGNAETTYVTPSGNSVGWAWKAGSTSGSNTNGSITSTVSVNSSAGFSIVSFNATGSAATVGHGLGVAPEFIMAKRRNSGDWWATYSQAKGNTGTMFLNQTTDDVQSIYWNNTSPTSSVFSIGTYYASSAPVLAYCFASIDGYSKFGSYIGNGSTDGTFVYTGFRARYIMIRKVGNGFWLIYDTSRNTYNVVDNQIYANLAQIDPPSATFDILSNGFKLRSSDSNRNANGSTIFYAAFAENPFKNSLAR